MLKSLEEKEKTENFTVPIFLTEARRIHHLHRLTILSYVCTLHPLPQVRRSWRNYYPCDYNHNHFYLETNAGQKSKIEIEFFWLKETKFSTSSFWKKKCWYVGPK